jgi:hypothetical protein
MIVRNDLPLRHELTELEEAAISVAFMARGVAYQHQDLNYDAACEAAERIGHLIKGAHAVRQEAEKMRKQHAAKPTRATMFNALSGELS